MTKSLLRIFSAGAGVYAFICGFLYFWQEKLIFFPEKLDKNYKFNFGQKSEEIYTKTSDGKLMHGLLFKAEKSKGLIFYLHGNGSSLSLWGDVASTYTNLNYDVYMNDFRGYGKSEGEISSQLELYEDNQIIYDELKNKYNEDDIIVLGYSLGTGLAAKLASDNNPKLLILQAPYYSMIDMMQKRYPFVPAFLLKYKFATNEYLKKVKAPVVIFHGNQDEVIYYGSSLKLKSEFKPGDTLITLDNQLHNGMTNNNEYKAELKKVLQKYE